MCEDLVGYFDNQRKRLNLSFFCSDTGLYFFILKKKFFPLKVYRNNANKQDL